MHGEWLAFSSWPRCAIQSLRSEALAFLHRLIGVDCSDGPRRGATRGLAFERGATRSSECSATENPPALLDHGPDVTFRRSVQQPQRSATVHMQQHWKRG